MDLSVKKVAAVIAAMSLAACGPPQTAEQDAALTATTTERMAAPPPAARKGPSARPSAPAVAPILTPEGFGPLRVGMTLSEVTTALGPDADPNAVGGPDPESCDQFRPARAPEGVLVMMEQGRLARISLIGKSAILTDRGVGLGSSAAAVKAAYKGAALSSAHKYRDAPAEYLTYWSRKAEAGDRASPTDRGIVFEVDERGVVDLIHAGGPSIQYVEGCL